MKQAGESLNAQRAPHPSLGSQYWFTCTDIDPALRVVAEVSRTSACRTPAETPCRGADRNGNATYTRALYYFDTFLFCCSLHLNTVCGSHIRMELVRDFLCAIKLKFVSMTLCGTYIRISFLLRLFFEYLFSCEHREYLGKSFAACRRRMSSVWNKHPWKYRCRSVRIAGNAYTLYCFDVLRGNTCWNGALQWRLGLVQMKGWRWIFYFFPNDLIANTYW